LESSAKTKASTPQLILRRRSGQLSIFGGESLSPKQKDSVFGIIFTHLLMTKEGESNSKGSNESVFGDLCQRGREHEPKAKAKAPHHHHFKILVFQLVLSLERVFQIGMIFKFGIFLCSKRGESSNFKINILKPS
jgi:hypothetical protein